MFGKRKNQRNKFNQKQISTSQYGNCVCPQCNYTVAHQRGIPCVSLLCPKCNIPLVRQTQSENNNKQPAPNKNNKSSSFPTINTELCVGCGACVKRCPADAIKIENGKAKINNEICKKCKVCVNACPVNAIT